MEMAEKIKLLDSVIKAFDELTIADMRNPQIRDRMMNIARMVNAGLDLG